MFVWSYGFRVGRDNWWKAHTNHDPSQTMGASNEFSWFAYQCHRLQIRTEITRPGIGHMLSRRYYTDLRGARHYESVAVDVGLRCCMQNAIELLDMEPFNVSATRSNDCGKWNSKNAQIEGDKWVTENNCLLLCRPAATKYKQSAVTIRVYFYSSTVSLAMANGQKRNRSMCAIPCMTLHLHQMLADPITYLL